MQEKKKESKFANIIGTLLIILCVPLLFAFITVAIKANTNHDKVPDFFGYKPLICASNSMSNVFKVGDLTITKAVPEDELKTGDIITFWNENHNMVITHRIDKIEVDENGKKIYITKGDRNNEVDAETVEYSQIEGKYVTCIKYIGNIILILQKPIGLIIAFLIPIIICALSYRKKLQIEKRKDLRKEKLLKRLEEKHN